MSSLEAILALRSSDPPPILSIDLRLDRLLDKTWCKDIVKVLKQEAGPWEVRVANPALLPTIPEQTGIYMFVWHPHLKLQTTGRSQAPTFRWVMYIGRAGDAANKNTLRSRFREYAEYLNGDPELLWGPVPKTRHERLATYLTLRPLEYWFVEVADRKKIRALERRLIDVFSPPLNDEGVIKARFGAASKAWR